MKLLCFLAFALSSLGLSAQNPKTELWAEILQGAVSDSGEVDYIWIDKHSSKLEEFVESYRSTNPGRWNESEKKAYYLNFYNASMIYNLLRYARSSNIKVDSKDFLSNISIINCLSSSAPIDDGGKRLILLYISCEFLNESLIWSIIESKALKVNVTFVAL